ncbi:unnamed protein product, partial [Staurois parvus]
KKEKDQHLPVQKITGFSLTACLQGTYTPFLPRPISISQHCHTLNDNCAVMQHCTHMKFLAFFV